MTERSRTFSGKKFYHYAVVSKPGVAGVVQFFKNRNYLVRTTPDSNPLAKGYREIWTHPKVKKDDR
jgi:hypothetical protein